jgi:hypothetical protein
MGATANGRSREAFFCGAFPVSLGPFLACCDKSFLGDGLFCLFRCIPRTLRDRLIEIEAVVSLVSLFLPFHFLDRAICFGVMPLLLPSVMTGVCMSVFRCLLCGQLLGRVRPKVGVMFGDRFRKSVGT